MTEDRKFYVYEHWRPDTGQCFYVGKGSGRRAWSMRKRNRHHKSIVSKLTSMGMSVDIRIIIDGLSETTAFSLEIDRISSYPKAQLANKTAGGTGLSGNRLSDERKKQISKATSGRKLSEAHKAKVGDFFRGRKLSAEHVQKLRMANSGKKPSQNTINASILALKGKKRDPSAVEKTAASRRGKKLTPEHCAAISAGQKGRKVSDEQKAKLREAWKTRPPITEETRKKLSDSAKADWAKRRSA